MMNWLEPSIVKRVDEVTENSEALMQPMDDEFKSIFKTLSRKHPESTDKLIQLESLFMRRYELVDMAYRCGLKDGLKF